MMWRKSRRLKLFLLLGLPVACFGQTAGGGSSTASNPLNVYAPPCISQVKQYIGVSCQITPTGGAQPYSYTFTGGFPTGMSMSTGLGGGLINGTPTGITGEQATVTVTDVGGGTAATSFMITPAGLTGSGPCGSSVCVTGAGYAIKTAEGYTITTLATVQMAATTYWSDGSTLDVTSMATWACTPSPQCGSVSASGLYTTGNSVGTYHVTATLSGVTSNGGSGVAVTVATIQAHTKESDRVANSGMVMRDVLQLRSGIPAAVLQKAECVIVVPSTLKFAVGVGGSYGRGVMTCRGGPDFQGPWSAPSMMAVGGGGFGLQVGGQATDFVLLLMNDRAANSILTSKVKIGATASAAGGPVGRESTAATDLFLRAEILSYSRARGLFAGVSLEGSTLRPDNRANRKLYGKDVSAKAIVLQGEVSPPSSALELLSILNSKSPTNRSAGGAPPPPNHPPLSAYVQGEKTKAKGLITARTGDTIVLKTTDGSTMTVTLDDDTKVQQPKGLGIRKKQMSAAVLIPGLKVSVDGTSQDATHVLAKSITFDGDDLETAEMIQAGLSPTEQKVAANQRNIEENERNIEANKQGIDANQQNIAANKTTIDANAAETSKRFSDLTEYDTKDQLVVQFASASSDISAADQEALRKLAQNAVNLKGYIIQVKGFADSSGNAAMNQNLSMERAQNVIAFLLQNCNVPVRHIVAPGAMGEAAPVASNETAAGRAENRRVEVKVLLNKGLAGD
jgi:lipid-binding SYLF domain-containing protein/outer membrane protein OmpA-like peptidoglycan-associated protein